MSLLVLFRTPPNHPGFVQYLEEVLVAGMPQPGVTLGCTRTYDALGESAAATSPIPVAPPP